MGDSCNPCCNPCCCNNNGIFDNIWVWVIIAIIIIWVLSDNNSIFGNNCC